MNNQSMIKFILCGDSSTGKSSIIIRFAKDTFSESLNSTIGVDIVVKRVDYQGSTYKLQIVDTAGQEKFQSLATLYFRGAKAIIFVYAINSRQSFESVMRWVELARRNCDTPNFVGILVGNKIDLENQREVSYQDGLDLAQRENFLFLECSAKTAVGVDETFEDAFNAVMVQHEENEAKQQQLLMQQQMMGDVLNDHENDEEAINNKVDLDHPNTNSVNSFGGCC